MSKIMAGDRVTVQDWNGTYDVKGVSGDFAWILFSDRDDDDKAAPMTMHTRYLKKIEPFFEVGKVYERPNNWSIPFQEKDCYERFTPTQVERGASGLPIAFGKLELLNAPKGMPKQYQWHTMGAVSFRLRWKEVSL